MTYEASICKYWIIIKKMDAKTKAQQLVDKYMPTTYFGVHKEQAKACAIIAVDEIMNEVLPIGARSGNERHLEIYWTEVKNQINLL